MWEERLETTVLYLEKQATKQSLAPVVQLSRRLIYLKPNTQKWFWKTDCKYITPFPCLRCIKYQPVLVWYQLFNIPAESTSFSSFQRLPVCSHKYIEGWLKICTPYLIYSHIWLNLSRDDCHFFCTSSMDDCYLILYIYPWYWNWYKIGTRLVLPQVPSRYQAAYCLKQYQPGRVCFVPVRKCWLQVQVYIHQTNIGINNTAFILNSSTAFWCIIITTSLQILGGALEQSTPISTLQFMSTNEYESYTKDLHNWVSKVGDWSPIGVSYSNFCVLWFWLSPSLLSKFKKKKFSFKQSWTAQRESAPNSWLAMLDMIYESNIWKSTNHHGIVSLPFMLNFQTKIMRDDRTVLRHGYVILVAKWTWWRKSNQIKSNTASWWRIKSVAFF